MLYFQAVLALYAARRTSGIVVNIGFQVITILPSKLFSLYDSTLFVSSQMLFNDMLAFRALVTHDVIPFVELNLIKYENVNITTCFKISSCISLILSAPFTAVLTIYFYSVCSAVFHGKVMRQVGVEVIGFGALKLTGFLKEKMQENNISFQSLYTVRTLKEVLPLTNVFPIVANYVGFILNSSLVKYT